MLAYVSNSAIRNQQSTISTHARTRLTPTPDARFADAPRLLVSRLARRPRRAQSASSRHASRNSADRRSRPPGPSLALRDACPHRGMPLHDGHFDGTNVECPYHGWTFDAHTGQCQLIPSLTADQNLKVDRIYAGSYPCEEQDDFIWVY